MAEDFALAIAKEGRDFEALFRFRYRIYVEEMNRFQKYADPNTKQIRDPLDVHAFNIVAWRSDVIVGCVRVNLCHNSDVGYYSDILRMRDVGDDFPGRSSLCTRLMVRSDFRRSSLACRLSIAALSVGLENDVVWNFIDGNDHLVPFFSRLGFEKTHEVVHEEYGRVNAMRLNIRLPSRLADLQRTFGRTDSAGTLVAAA
ncbi:MAG: GNAT family N-acyltransferase [Alphaproteobacteria bacterium]